MKTMFTVLFMHLMAGKLRQPAGTAPLGYGELRMGSYAKPFGVRNAGSIALRIRLKEIRLLLPVAI
jgi:hypothetical protein